MKKHFITLVILVIVFISSIGGCAQKDTDSDSSTTSAETSTDSLDESFSFGGYIFKVSSAWRKREKEPWVYFYSNNSNAFIMFQFTDIDSKSNDYQLSGVTSPIEIKSVQDGIIDGMQGEMGNANVLTNEIVDLADGNIKAFHIEIEGDLGETHTCIEVYCISTTDNNGLVMVTFSKSIDYYTDEEMLADYKEVIASIEIDPEVITEETEIETHEHIWIDATCTEPKTCSVCGEKVGSPLGHDVDDMTCTTGGTCNRCGDEVEAPGHKWKDATCTEPKTCSVCGETEGEALGHTTSFGKCSRCGLEFYEPLKGNGDDVLTDINLSDGLYRAHIVYSGSGNFVVWIHDENDYKDLLVNTIGSYDGYVLIASPTSIYFEIKSSGDWSIQFEKLTNTSETSFSGNGDNVTDLFSSSAKKWHIHYEGESNFVVKGYSTKGTELLVNTIGSYDGNVLFEIPSGGLAFFEVLSSGSWIIEPA